MKKTKLIYAVLLVIILAFGSAVWYHQVQTEIALKQFFKTYRIKRADIRFKTAELSFLGDGLIFYRVQLPQLALTHKIDKVIIQTEAAGVNVQLIGVEVDVIDTLRRSHGIYITNTLETYQPFKEALIKPLESLALMGIDKVKLNAVFSFEPFKKVIVINGKITAPQLADIYFSFPLSRRIDTGYQKSLVYAFYGTIEDIFFEIRDRGIFKKYRDYMEGEGIVLSIEEKSDLTDHQPIIRKVKLASPLLLMKNYRTTPKEQKETIPDF